MSKEKYYFSKSLEKGLKILALYNRQTPVWTQSQISKTLGLNMTSTHRYISTLVQLGYLDKDPKTREIRPSIRSLLFCNNLMRATDHLQMIQATVDQIHSRHNISIDVAFVKDRTLMRLYHREAEETLIYRLPDITQNCLHNTALGKAYLSSLTEDQLAEKINSLVLVAKTEKTITDKHALAEELQKTRARRFAISVEEYLPGLISIGAPLLDPFSGGGTGAVSFDFSVLQHSARKIENRYGDLIVETAKALSALLPPNHGSG